MIHYHGTPITPHAMRQRMAGRHFCVSFARPDDADWCLAHGQAVMWDCGAYSAYTRGRIVDFGQYCRWLEPRLGHPHWAIVPDVIGGGVDDQRALIQQWPHARELGAPVWHMGLPVDWLLELADRWPRLCFGSSAEYWQVGSDAWCRRADAAFNALARRGLEPWVHMLRGLKLCGQRWPFASADSCNVAINYKRNGVCPEEMARRIDSVQCPIQWQLQPEQSSLLVGAA